MHKIKAQKGITLIALVITIVVMLVLVGVTITVSLNGGLFTTAKEATAQMQIDIEKEQLLTVALGTLGRNGKINFSDIDNNLPDNFTRISEGKYESTTGNKYQVTEDADVILLDGTEGDSEEGGTITTIIGKWQQNGNQIQYVTENGTVITTLSIGDKVAYDETDGTPLAYETDATKGTGVNYTSGALVAGKYTIAGTGEGETAAGNLEWRVLGVNEEGQLELISTTPTTNKLYLYGKAGYENAETVNGVKGTLDTFCDNLYGKGAGAESARSLTAEDINKLGNFNPETDYSDYGTEYTYKFVTEEGHCCTNAVYGINSEDVSQDISKWTCTCYETFYTPDWTINSTNIGPQTFRTTYYYYKISDEVSITDPVDMATLITKGENGSTYLNQWLSSRVVDNYLIFLYFDVQYISSNNLGIAPLYTWDEVDFAYDYFVRPVVTLNSNVNLTANSDGIYEIN